MSHRIAPPTKLRRAALAAAWTLATGLALIAGGDPARAFSLAAFCAANPLHPLCCPSPCPVVDPSQVARLASTAKDAATAVSSVSSMADSRSIIGDLLAPSRGLAATLRRSATTMATEAAEIAKVVPKGLSAGELSTAASALSALSSKLVPAAGSTLSTIKSLDQARTETAHGEAVAALTTGYNAFDRLDDVVKDTAARVNKAAAAATARDDLAANTAARQSLVDNIAGLQNLLSAWAALQSSGKFAANPGGLATASVSSAGSSAATAALLAQAETLARLRTVRQKINGLDAVISEAVALHNDRYGVSVMLAQYAGLQATINAHEAAIAARDAASAGITSTLATIYVDGGAAFKLVRARLLALDTTGWKDNTSKSGAAQAAAQTVVNQILTEPKVFGTLRNDAEKQVLQSDGTYVTCILCTPEAFRDAMAEWLEFDKYERFWQPLRQSAEATLAQLEARVAEVGALWSLNMKAGSATLAAEQALLNSFNAGYAELSAMSTSGFSTDQSTTVQQFSAAMKKAATDAVNDPNATTLVLLEWPK